VDEFRFAHHSHSGGNVPLSLARYLDQRHWLYLATFANGMTKVGTASDVRKISRVDEQGAFVVTYVTDTPDGRTVRRLEDEVSTAVGLAQQVSRTAKLGGLTRPKPMDVLARHHQNLLGQVAEHAHRIVGRQVSPEPWDPPPAYAPVIDAHGRDRYGQGLGAGEHGLTIKGCAGPIVLVTLRAESGVEFFADLGQTKGLRLTLGDFESPQQATQASLF
jgi:hypothetical protein